MSIRSSTEIAANPAITGNGPVNTSVNTSGAPSTQTASSITSGATGGSAPDSRSLFTRVIDSIVAFVKMIFPCFFDKPSSSQTQIPPVTITQPTPPPPPSEAHPTVAWLRDQMEAGAMNRDQAKQAYDKLPEADRAEIKRWFIELLLNRIKPESQNFLEICEESFLGGDYNFGIVGLILATEEQYSQKCRLATFSNDLRTVTDRQILTKNKALVDSYRNLLDPQGPFKSAIVSYRLKAAASPSPAPKVLALLKILEDQLAPITDLDQARLLFAQEQFQPIRNRIKKEMIPHIIRAEYRSDRLQLFEKVLNNDPSVAPSLEADKALTGPDCLFRMAVKRHASAPPPGVAICPYSGFHPDKSVAESITDID